MNLDVTISATGVLRVLVVRWASRLIRSHAVVHAVTRQAQVIDLAELQHARVSRSMRYVTGDATVSLHGSMFEREWTLLVCVTLEARGVGTDRQPRLLQLEAAVRIVAIAAFHRAFEDLVMRREGELVFDFTVAVQAKLRLTDFQQMDRGEIRFFCVCRGDECV